MDEINKKFMARAIELAKENVNSNNGGPFGAVIVKDGKIIGEGINSVTKTNDPTAHAEITAIRQACKKIKSFKLDGCEIYSSTEPCPMCLGAIYWACLKKIYYATTRNDVAKADFIDSLIYKEFELPEKARSIPSEQIMRKESLEVLKEWEKNDCKVEY
jgi:tRNA(Arg) A34 adenosine deaminase TadA